MIIIVYLLCAVTSNAVLISFRFIATPVYACARRSAQFQMLAYRCCLSISVRACVCECVCMSFTRAWTESALSVYRCRICRNIYTHTFTLANSFIRTQKSTKKISPIIIVVVILLVVFVVAVVDVVFSPSLFRSLVLRLINVFFSLGWIYYYVNNNKFNEIYNVCTHQKIQPISVWSDQGICIKISCYLFTLAFWMDASARTHKRFNSNFCLDTIDTFFRCCCCCC